ncbi:helix-turn-helix protein [Pirellula sp. SH-Sr6A]|uniref:nuclear transport factor 2 family protein n=1 Tax=Pirellula sp. SH-Sr6A TaxID=1632865 RepID=UPI00078D46CC|nr:nuclear transport factor 2 family protein [Pirellula sp. SH-Sr6A]AMV34200.1 helix-turn-helix protein [Pirellula sp. SH-Sr6A]
MNNSGWVVNGRRLAEFRKLAGMTQLDLAARSGYSERAIRKAEAGGFLRISTLHDLAEALSTAERRVAVQELVLNQLTMAMQFVDAYDRHGVAMMQHCGEIFSEDVELHCPGDNAQVPFAGVWRGRDGLQLFFDLFFSVFSRTRGSLKPVYLESDHRIVARYEDQVFFESHPMPPFWVNLHFQFQDGRIVRVDDEYDTRYASQCFMELLQRLGRL